MPNEIANEILFWTIGIITVLVVAYRVNKKELTKQEKSAAEIYNEKKLKNHQIDDNQEMISEIKAEIKNEQKTKNI